MPSHLILITVEAEAFCPSVYKIQQFVLIATLSNPQLLSGGYRRMENGVQKALFFCCFFFKKVVARSLVSRAVEANFEPITLHSVNLHKYACTLALSC